jgi:tRNA(Ile2) C34 agmatinyltransferase TiaS
MYLIGIDDTDNLESRGTGNLARQIASELSHFSHVLGVTRHQLLVDPRVPYTKNNSSAAIFVETSEKPEQLLDYVLSLMSSSIQTGSDPGLCLAANVPQDVSTFGYRAKRELVTQKEARALAAVNSIYLHGISGDEGGVIGALAAVGLAASGDDGRYIQLGMIRELTGLQPIKSLLDA